jgi:hypothetical protein
MNSLKMHEVGRPGVFAAPIELRSWREFDLLKELKPEPRQ